MQLMVMNGARLDEVTLSVGALQERIRCMVAIGHHMAVVDEMVVSLKAMDAEQVGSYFELSPDSVRRLRDKKIDGAACVEFLHSGRPLSELETRLIDSVDLSVREAMKLCNGLGRFRPETVANSSVPA